MYLRSNAKIYNRSARRFIEVPYTLHYKTVHHIYAYMTTNSQHTSDHGSLLVKHFPARVPRTFDISTCGLLLLLLLCYILFSFLTLCRLLLSWGHGYTNSFFRHMVIVFHPKYVYIRDTFIPGKCIQIILNRTQPTITTNLTLHILMANIPSSGMMTTFPPGLRPTVASLALHDDSVMDLAIAAIPQVTGLSLTLMPLFQIVHTFVLKKSKYNI
jgi:hypothetical protein